MSNRNLSKQPLLYIHQPELRKPQPKMQEAYSTRKDNNIAYEEDVQTEPKLETATPVDDLDLDMSERETDQTAQENNNFLELKADPIGNPDASGELEADVSPFTTSKQGRYAFKKVKSFKEMDINERLVYLAKFPKQLPPVPCLFITEETAYKGYLKTVEEDEVQIVLSNKKPVSIPLNLLKEVKMAGYM